MDTFVHIACIIWTALVLVVGAILVVGIAFVGALFLLPILVFAMAFA